MTSSTLVLLVTLWASGVVKSMEYQGNIVGKTPVLFLREGKLQGLVVAPKSNTNLNNVAAYFGVPYAAPPVGSQRFMPPGSPPPWPGTKQATSLPPVCPQSLPDLGNEPLRRMSSGRYNYLKRLLPYLQQQSEDCLYLNIYAPAQEGPEMRQLPVLVYIHGESFEWNSGNPYDGSVLASYGDVIVVTINFRLGILGFLRPGVDEQTVSNFGLLDQLAALQWIKDSISAFGGDPESVTLVGHGTGAACVNLLMISPVSQGAHGLFHRAILMSGSALADWAVVRNPLQATIQVSQLLNCPQEPRAMADCLRRKRLSELMAARVHAPPFAPAFGPVVDGTVIPNRPAQVMRLYRELFSRYEMMYGVTEVESYHLLDAVSLAHGMLEEDRYQLLKDYIRVKFEVLPDVALAKTIAQYTDWMTSQSRSAAEEHRDSLLNMLSDSMVAAPLVQTALYHAAVNTRSFFYVWRHRSKMAEHMSMDKSVHGEELPYVFGIPLDGGRFHYPSNYNLPEKLLSEVTMTLWTNFAKTGNPNAPNHQTYFTQGPREWRPYDLEWPEFNTLNQSYLAIDIPPRIEHHYRSEMMQYWNQFLPESLKHPSAKDVLIRKPPPPAPPPSGHDADMEVLPPPWPPVEPVYPDHPDRRFRPDVDRDADFFQTFVPKRTTATAPTYGVVTYHGSRVGQMDGPGGVKTPPLEVDADAPEEISDASSLTLSIVILVGVCFLLVNLCAFAGIYYQRDRLKVQQRIFNTRYRCVAGESVVDEDDRYVKKVDEAGVVDAARELKRCEVKSILKSSEGLYEPVKLSVKDGSRVGGRWTGMSRQASSSTMSMDPHTKVREWIAQEIVQRCSPRFLRRGKGKSNDTYDQVSSNTQDKDDRSVGSKAAGSVGGSTLRRANVSKVSVAVDATPATRSASVLKQTPIELTKSKSLDGAELGLASNSLDGEEHGLAIKRPSLQRSEALSPDSDSEERLTVISGKEQMRRSSTSINLQLSQDRAPAVVHFHSRSDPLPRIDDHYSQVVKKDRSLKTFDPSHDVNVTSKDEGEERCVTHEEALVNIKRRNFPKVLPDLPEVDVRSEKSFKRLSLPPTAHTLSAAVEVDPIRMPPPPPPRVSTLGRRHAPAVSKSHLTVRLVNKDTPEGGPCMGLPVKTPTVPAASGVVHKPEDSSPTDVQMPPLESTGLPETLNKSQKPSTTAARRAEPRVIIKPTITAPVTRRDVQPSQIPRVMAASPASPHPEPPRQVATTLTRGQPSGPQRQNAGMGAKLKINPVKKSVSTETSSDSSAANTGTTKKAKK